MSTLGRRGLNSNLITHFFAQQEVKVRKELRVQAIYFGIYGIPTLADRRKKLKLCSFFQMNGQISFPMANAPLVRRPALNLRNWFLYNKLYTQVHINFPSFPMLSLCGTNYQTLCMTVRLSFHSSTVYILCTSGCLLYMQLHVLLFPLSFCYLFCINWVHSMLYSDINYAILLFMYPCITCKAIIKKEL